MRERRNRRGGGRMRGEGRYCSSRISGSLSLSVKTPELSFVRGRSPPPPPPSPPPPETGSSRRRRRRRTQKHVPSFARLYCLVCDCVCGWKEGAALQKEGFYAGEGRGRGGEGRGRGRLLKREKRKGGAERVYRFVQASPSSPQNSLSLSHAGGEESCYTYV